MIEPSPQSPSEPQRSATSSTPQADPIVLEDLAAAIRIPGFFKRLHRVLARGYEVFHLPQDAPLSLVSPEPGDGVVEYGFRWVDPQGLLQVFGGMSWGDQGHDPIWEVRVEATSVELAAILRAGHWHRLAARRADSRFSEWDRFWQEEEPTATLLFGASAAATRFLEEEDPEGTAARYLAGALYAMHASGALSALLEVAKDAVGGSPFGSLDPGHG
ncbi:MAG: hypothetical protein ACPG31_01970 [Planctomycetota bacterium]